MKLIRKVISPADVQCCIDKLTRPEANLVYVRNACSLLVVDDERKDLRAGPSQQRPVAVWTGVKEASVSSGISASSLINFRTSRRKSESGSSSWLEPLKLQLHDPEAERS
jgi:hypothetical protein